MIYFAKSFRVRAPIYAGDITGEDVFNVLPFDNMVDMVLTTYKLFILLTDQIVQIILGV